jgi:hypothetical protein
LSHAFTPSCYQALFSVHLRDYVATETQYLSTHGPALGRAMKASVVVDGACLTPYRLITARKQ